jgi:60 kDa SS-A/Ro ribonucleoprotein
MANRALFATKSTTAKQTINKAGGVAYAFGAEHTLAQLVATGCLNGTFYADAGEQLDAVLDAAARSNPTFVAKAAIHARESGMKDMPVLLTAYLSVKAPELLPVVFRRTVNNAKQLRSFVQIMRSGAVGRRSLGTRPKRLVRRWIEERAAERLFQDAVGAQPSLADLIKMVHPKPDTAAREALYGYLIGKTVDLSLLPPIVQEYEAYKAKPTGTPPAVPFQKLTGLELPKEAWKSIAANGGWQMTRINLNTFRRHGVLEDPGMVRRIAKRLANRAEIRKAKAMPYQLMAAWLHAGNEMPREIVAALQTAMDVATENVPVWSKRVAVLVDVSGSMSSPISGYRQGATSKMRAVDCAALFASAVLRNCPNAEVIPFDHGVRDCVLQRRDPVPTNAEKLARLCGGGTDCAAPLQYLLGKKKAPDLVILVSDNESWIDQRPGWRREQGTRVLEAWDALKKKNRHARLVCLDVQPYSDTQPA